MAHGRASLVWHCGISSSDCSTCTGTGVASRPSPLSDGGRTEERRLIPKSLETATAALVIINHPEPCRGLSLLSAPLSARCSRPGKAGGPPSAPLTLLQGRASVPVPAWGHGHLLARKSPASLHCHCIVAALVQRHAHLPEARSCSPRLASAPPGVVLLATTVEDAIPSTSAPPAASLVTWRGHHPRLLQRYGTRHSAAFWGGGMFRSLVCSSLARSFGDGKEAAGNLTAAPTCSPSAGKTWVLLLYTACAATIDSHQPASVPVYYCLFSPCMPIGWDGLPPSETLACWGGSDWLPAWHPLDSFHAGPWGVGCRVAQGVPGMLR